MTFYKENDVTVLEDSVQTTMVDADLYVRYKSPEKAFTILREAIEKNPHSIALREKFREIGATHGNLDAAAEQCLALASLYIRTANYDLAHDRLREAKALDQRISITSGLEAIRVARLKEESDEIRTNAITNRKDPILRGDMALISVFDIVDVIDNSRLTGLLLLKSANQVASIAFNVGKIVDAQADGLDNMSAFQKIIEMETGEFEFFISEESFPVEIQVESNKNFLLNSIASLEAEKAERDGVRDLRDEEI